MTPEQMMHESGFREIGEGIEVDLGSLRAPIGFENVDDGWMCIEAAKRFLVALQTAIALVEDAHAQAGSQG